MANVQDDLTAIEDLKADGVVHLDDDRRDFPRYPIPNRLGVELRVLPATEVIAAEIQDLSREGVGLVTKVFIAPGETITFPVGDDWVVAEVRHCRTGEGGYAVGGMITDIIAKKEIDASTR